MTLYGLINIYSYVRSYSEESWLDEGVTIVYQSNSLEDLNLNLREVLKRPVCEYQKLHIVEIPDSYKIFDLRSLTEKEIRSLVNQSSNIIHCSISWGLDVSKYCANGFKYSAYGINLSSPNIMYVRNIITNIKGDNNLQDKTIFKIDGMKDYFKLGYKVFSENWNKKTLKQMFSDIGYPKKRMIFRSKASLRWSFLETYFNKILI